MSPYDFVTASASGLCSKMDADCDVGLLWDVGLFWRHHLATAMETSLATVRHQRHPSPLI